MAGRYHRQTLLPQVGDAGQAKISSAIVVVIGCGALGTVISEGLARAGVGRLILCDRDLVEPSNLQRQTLFTDADAAESRPKAVAAAERLRLVNGDIAIEPRPIDVDASNVVGLVDEATLLLDGTDNASTRYLLNDACIQADKPWIYGAAVATEGRVMPVLPGNGPCLRCIFRDPPPAGVLATCDTAGVLAPAAGVVANLQVATALRLLVEASVPLQMTAIDVWTGRFSVVDVAEARQPDCPCCGQRNFEFLQRDAADTAALCGQNAVQVRSPTTARWDLVELGKRLGRVGNVSATPFMLRFQADDNLRVTAFADARIIVQGTTDVAAARSVYARYFGN